VGNGSQPALGRLNRDASMKMLVDDSVHILKLRGSRRSSIAPTASAMRDEIKASQSRSVQFGLRDDHVVLPFEPGVESRSRLTELARPILDRVCDDLADTPVSLLLADAKARIIDRRVGRGALRSALDCVQLSRGHCWSERCAGTNALGTALAWAAPIIVSGREHFANALAGVTCAAATITDPGTGQFLGAVGLACAVQDRGALMLPYACHLGRDIEGQLLDDVSAAERALLEHFVRAQRRTRGPIVSLNQRSMFTNAAASRFVRARDHELLWDWAEEAMVGQRPRFAEFYLAGGTRVNAQCEPVWFGSEPVGALVRLAVRAPVAAHDRSKQPATSPPLGWASLTAAELGVAELVAAGLTNREAARRLYLSPHTIDFHLRRVFGKLGISSRVALARIVADHRTESRTDDANTA
jgi:DNA-binding CsgD family transcriptional regulator